MKKAHILLIEDDASGREIGIFNLEKAGFRVDGAASGEQGLALFDPKKHDLIITDVRMPGISGMDILREIQKRKKTLPVIVITAYANVELAVEAMKAGASDFIGKPFSRDHLLLTVEKALEKYRLVQEVQGLRIQARGIERPIIFESEKMQRVIETSDRVAKSDATVLITGGSGTGKELIARRIHIKSERAVGPFVPVNAVAMPSELIESELFGHEKGSFTGASNARLGRFRRADKGSIFLDEISELPAALQAKMLRVLQEKVVDAVGADKPISVDVRIIAATNKDLETEVIAGTFRQDLLYRLNIVNIEVPPLDSRPEDIEPLAKHFIEKHGQGREHYLTKGAMDALASRPWPGNVRELENICQRLVILAESDEIGKENIPSVKGANPNGSLGAFGNMAWPPLPDSGLSLVDLEKSVIERVLTQKKGNVSQSAAYLGVPRHVLAYRMEKYGIPKK